MVRCPALALATLLPACAVALCPGAYLGTPPEGHAPVPDISAYAAAVVELDVDALVRDLRALITTPQDCWLPDDGSYAPLFLRLGWHCSFTYNKLDGTGGCAGGRQRFEPERSWGNNTNLDKARALLVPIKKKYGDALSWGDLMVAAADVAIMSMGGPLHNMCFGRLDDPDGTVPPPSGPGPQGVFRPPSADPDDSNAPPPPTAPPTTAEPGTPNPDGGDPGPYLRGSLTRAAGAAGAAAARAASGATVGLPVNAEGLGKPGPDGRRLPDPASVVADIRALFSDRYGFTDIETVALIGGGHAVGRAHGACAAGAGPPPAKNSTDPWPGLCGTGMGSDTFTSGFHGEFAATPNTLTNGYFKQLRDYTWEPYVGPGGKWQWRAQNATGAMASIIKLTMDVALLYDEDYKRILLAFADDDETFRETFAIAWLKLSTAGGRWSEQTRCYAASRFL